MQAGGFFCKDGQFKASRRFYFFELLTGGALIGLTKASVSATVRSNVWITVTFLAPCALRAVSGGFDGVRTIRSPPEDTHTYSNLTWQCRRCRSLFGRLDGPAWAAAKMTPG